MKAIIQAGGKGTRLRSITKDLIPKPMVVIAGKPLLQWQIEKLMENGIMDIYLVIGHLGKAIQDYFGTGEKFGVHISYIKEMKPLGSAGALFYLKPYIEPEEDILFLYGDVFFDIDISRMLTFHQERQGEITTFVHPNTHPEDSDLLETDNEQQVIRFLSKKEKRDFWYENQVNAACYILKGSVIWEIEQVEKLDFESDILAKKVSEGTIYAYRSTEYIKDAGTQQRLCSIEENLLSDYIAKRNLKHKQKCIFLDRDGTINVLNGLVDCEEKLELIPGVVEAIRKINESEYLAIVVTNQPVVARGMCTIEEVENIHRKLQTLLGEQGVYLDDIAYCPHHPDKGYPEENKIYKIPCNCRKPAVGMLEKMAEKYNISLKDSWMIGDTTRDIMTGKNAGMKTALLLTGEAGKDGCYDVQADIQIQSLSEIERILQFER